MPRLPHDRPLRRSASDGGAIINYGVIFNIGGSILANNGGATCTNDRGIVTDQGYNLTDESSICGKSVNTDLLGNAYADLGPLTDNGGPTQTMALLPGSQAIDQIPTSNATLCPTSGTDQRGAGYTRPDNSETACDIGAYENQDAGGVTQQSQTITFGTLPNKTYGAAPFTISATASSGLAVSFSSTTTGVCTVSGSTVSIVSAGTCTIDADQAGNNNSSAALQVQRSFTVARATLNVAANDQSMTYGGTVPTFDATSTGLVNGDTFAHLGGSCSASVNGSAVSSSTSASSYPGAITCSGVDTTNYTVTYTAGTLTVNKALFTVTADNQGPVQYSDPMPALTAVISGFVNGQTLATRGVSGSPSCSTAAGVTAVLSGQGSYAIICSVGTLAAANYSFPSANFVDGSLSVTQETAAIQYTGGSAVMLPSSGSASITLSATVWNSAAKGYPSWGATDPDGLTTDTPGDVTKMFVQWEIWPSGSCLSGTPSTIVGPVAVTQTSSGIGTASGTFAQSTDGSFCVVAQVVGTTASSPNQYYTADDTQVAGIAFYTNTGQFATGGGWIADSTGPGALSFNARCTKKGGAKGQMAYSWQAFYNGQLANYTITSNAISTLTFSGTTSPITATLQGKAAESIVSVATGQQVDSQGNLTFTASATDGDYGQAQNIRSDAFSLSVFNSSNQTIKQVTTPLSGGNLVVHNG